MVWVHASEDEDEANLAVYHARRFLWKAQVEGLEPLEDHLGRALTSLEEHRKNAERRADEAGRKAGVPGDADLGGIEGRGEEAEKDGFPGAKEEREEFDARAEVEAWEHARVFLDSWAAMSRTSPSSSLPTKTGLPQHLPDGMGTNPC